MQVVKCLNRAIAFGWLNVYIYFMSLAGKVAQYGLVISSSGLQLAVSRGLLDLKSDSTIKIPWLIHDNYPDTLFWYAWLTIKLTHRQQKQKIVWKVRYKKKTKTKKNMIKITETIWLMVQCFHKLLVFVKTALYVFFLESIRFWFTWESGKYFYYAYSKLQEVKVNVRLERWKGEWTMWPRRWYRLINRLFCPFELYALYGLLFTAVVGLLEILKAHLIKRNRCVRMSGLIWFNYT